MSRDRIGVIREFKTAQFRVVVDAEYDYDADLSFDNTGEVRRKLESGEYVCFSARAAVYFRGTELASDYLGGCIYEDIAQFQDHRACGKQNREYKRKKKAGRCGSYFADMIKTACAEARKELRKMQSVRVRDVITI